MAYLATLLVSSDDVKKCQQRVTYWDKMSRSYEEIDSDNKLLHAIDMY